MQRLGLSILFLTMPLAVSSAAQTVVTAGDDLAAVVAAAPDGDVIRIDSNATFNGPLSWEGKSLTIEAGAGFSPTILGETDEPEPAFELRQTGDDTTGVIARGLTLETGALPGALVPPPAISLTSEAGSTGDLSCVFEDCQAFAGTLCFFEGSATIDLAWRGGLLGNDSAEGFNSITSRGPNQVSVVLEQGCKLSTLFVSSEDGALGLRAEDCAFSGSFTLSAGNPLSIFAPFGSLDAEVRRCRVGQSMLTAGFDGSTTTALFESTLFAPTTPSGEDSGVRVEADSSARLVNCTIAGWDTGLRVQGAFQGDNLAIFGNQTDVLVLGATIDLGTSLVADGSYMAPGVVNQVPLWDTDYSLRPGSPGIDAGSNTATDLGSLDLDGQPRIQDGNEDGTARVNFGAIETVDGCGLASIAPLPGSGINANGLLPSGPPVLGQSFQAQIQQDIDTVFTLLAIDAPSPAPFPIPGIEGEILLGLTPNLLLDYGVSLGLHQLPVPNDPLLCGAQTACQGLRVNLNLFEPVPEVVALNAYLVTLGS